MSSIGESEVPLLMEIKFPVVPDCDHCIISRGRVPRAMESDGAGITAVRSGNP